jgi:hypothetical protein
MLLELEFEPGKLMKLRNLPNFTLADYELDSAAEIWTDTSIYISMLSEFNG